MNSVEISGLREKWSAAKPEALLQHFLNAYDGRIAFATSLGSEDMLITDMIASIAPATKIFTLDTGRLFQESYDLITEIRSRYGISVQIYCPDTSELEQMLSKHGPNLFYESVENRKLCCRIRKLNPLRRALEGVDAWITGLRQEQSQGRSMAESVEWDTQHQILKLNPLAHLNNEELWHEIHQRKIPYHKLHDKGYPSIGCACCTRAILPGESIRAGRWAWEQNEHKECGLHLVDGKLKRTSLQEIEDDNYLQEVKR